jgi:hypothetical protein
LASLRKINFGYTIAESADRSFDYLNQNYKPISVPLTDNIAYYTSDFKHWIDSTNNWYSCDIFGKVSKKGLIPDYDLIVIVNDNQYLYSKWCFEISDVQKSKKLKLKLQKNRLKNSTTRTKFYLFYNFRNYKL